jgi:WD40 repeat protein
VDHNAPTLSTSAPLASEALPALPEVERDRYEVQAEVAQGGGGRLLRARDRRLERVVAIKLLRRLSSDQEARFRREALVTARLQHPGMVPVHEIGRWISGEPYYAMALVSGESLRDVLETRGSLRERMPLVPKLLAVAETMAYAHQAGIIHRDLTPANIMLGAFGEAVVVDWGLAKRVGDHEPKAAPDEPGGDGTTISGAVLGTPGYMAPEQARGESTDLRSDVYAIGAVLYRVLAGCAPYGSGDSDELIRAVVAGPPPLITEAVPDAAPELLAIVDKAMARAPNARYADAGELARDLRRFLDGQLVAAHRYSAWELVRRFVARHRAIVAFAAISLIALTAVGVYSFRRVVAERGRAELARDIAEARTNDLLLAQARLLVERKPTEAIAYLKSYAASASPSWPDVWKIATDARSKVVARHVFRDFVDARTSPDARWLIGRDRDGHVSVVDLTTLRATSPQLPSAKAVQSGLGAGFALGNDGVVRCWELPAGVPRELGRVDGDVNGLVASADGRRVAVVLPDGPIHVFGATGAHLVLRGHTASAAFVAFSPDGTLAASTGHDQVAYVWSLADSAPRHRLDIRGWGLAFSPDGKTLAIAGLDSKIWLVDVATGAKHALEGHTDRANHVAFSPDGATLYSTSVDANVRVWDLATGGSRVLVGHKLNVEEVTASPDGRFLVSEGVDQTIRLWDLALGESRVLLGHDDHVLQLVFAPDSRSLVTIDTSGQTRVWDLPSPPQLVPTGGQIDEMAADDTGSVWAMGSGRLRLLSTSGAELAHFDTPGIQTRVAASADGKYAATAGADGVVMLFARDRAQPRDLHGHNGDVEVLAFSPDGATLYSAGDDTIIRAWRTADGTLLRTFTGHEKAVYVLEPSPDGRWMLSGGDEKGARLWDLARGTSRVLPGTDMLFSASFTRDGSRVAWAAGGASVQMMSIADGVMRTFDGHRADTRMVALSPDGSMIATGSDDHTLTMCRLADGHCVTLPDDGPVHVLRFSRDGRRLLTNDDDHVARVFDVATGAELLAGYGEAHVIECVMSADGTRAFVSFAEDRVRVWTIDAAPPEPSRAWLDRLSTVQLGANGDVASRIAVEPSPLP